MKIKTSLCTVFVPAREPGRRRLMLVLHGLGDSVSGWSWFPDALRIPWLDFLLVNAPDPYGSGFAWYDIHSGEGIARSRDLVIQLLDSLEDYSPADIILSGFSQGCLMSLEVGARYPQRLAGIVGISGYLHSPDLLLKELSLVAKQQKFLVTHGTHDPLLPIDMVRGQVERLRQAGLQIDWREFVKDHTIAGEKELGAIREFIQSCYGDNKPA